jgi:hypothetical protein
MLIMEGKLYFFNIYKNFLLVVDTNSSQFSAISDC